MVAYLRRMRSNWDAVLAVSLVWIAIAINLGPAYYFLTLYLGGCGYIIQKALARPPRP